MKLGLLDFAVVGVYFILFFWMGLYLSRRGKKNLADFFLSDRKLSWWLAGTSMVATTFAADTPLAVTELVARHGVAGNWLWWSMALSGGLTVFFFAPLWRRSAVLTDLEFVELRYSGGAAAFLRGFRALYLGVLVNCIIMGWVHLGMMKILGGTLGIPKWTTLVVCLGLTVFYSSLAGLTGVVVTDVVQFVIAMAGSVILACVGWRAAGGWGWIGSAIAQTPALTGQAAYGSFEKMIRFWPDGTSVWMLPLVTFAVYLTVNWWASWYPGAEPGGGGYVAQRILATRTEREGLLATLWFNCAHYALRPWPWIVAALASIAIYGNRILDPSTGKPDAAMGYVKLMADFLPPGWIGVLLSSFLAAYMSTISTHLNWGSSYVIHDFYRRFLSPKSTEEKCLLVGRFTILFLAVCSLGVAYGMDRITRGWEILMLLGAGTGPVYILRWYWWRVNAWSEISAMSGALFSSLFLRYGLGWESQTPQGFAWTLAVTTGLTTILWLAVTLWTSPEPQERLERFYRLVRPAGPGWNPVRKTLLQACPDAVASVETSLVEPFMQWLTGCVFIYTALFGIGSVIFGKYLQSCLWFVPAVLSAAWLWRNLLREPAPQ